MWSIDSIARGRSEGILILSGGLTIHNLRDRACFHETDSADIYKQFDNAVTQAVQVRDVSGLLTPFSELPSRGGSHSELVL